MEEDAALRLAVLGRAPELVGVDPWFNTPDGKPLRLADLRGRVVLLDFWTFACVNCQRTLPFLRRTHDRYRPDLTVVGVHSPEFAFERSAENVERAVREHGLEYPVGLDNDFVAWNAYGNRYWPTMYLIDRAGQIRHTQIGEGNYRRTETAVRMLLAEAVGPSSRDTSSLLTTFDGFELQVRDWYRRLEPERPRVPVGHDVDTVAAATRAFVNDEPR